MGLKVKFTLSPWIKNIKLFYRNKKGLNIGIKHRNVEILIEILCVNRNVKHRCNHMSIVHA